jgi:hypothetical protein
MSQAVEAWAKSQGSESAAPSTPSPLDYAQAKKEMMAVGLAAVGGDPQAAARVQTFIRTMAEAHGEDAASLHIPNLVDVAAARRGDRAAITRLQAANRQQSASRQAKSGQTGLQTQSFLSFHPPLKKRLRRLERMGAHLQADVHRKMGARGRLVVGVLMLIFAPLLALVAGLMLVVIAMIIGLNLLFLTVWLAVIHAILVWWNGR